MSTDVVIVGAGIIGCSIASALVRQGLRVTLVEKSVPGAEASSVAAGILAPVFEHLDDDVMRALGIESRNMHRAQAEWLLANEGMDVGYRPSGALWTSSLALSTARVSQLHALGIPHTLLDRSGIAAHEPSLHPAIESAVLLPDEASIEPTRLLGGLLLACERGQVRIARGVVRGLLGADRVEGVVLESERIHAAHVVLAAGSWSSLLPVSSEGDRVAQLLHQVKPIRGQLVHGEAHPRLIQRVVFGDGTYIVPRGDGRYVCGATMEDAGFDREATFGGVHEVLQGALALAPAFAQAKLSNFAVNFRPKAPDGRPMIGASSREGLLIATGHHRNGILLAPITGQLVAQHIVKQTPFPAALCPLRFENSPRGEPVNNL